jgi:hypothetical protein
VEVRGEHIPLHQRRASRASIRNTECGGSLGLATLGGITATSLTSALIVNIPLAPFGIINCLGP